MNELVSCLCPTMDSRREFVIQAIDCFRAQDYAGPMELLVIGDSPYALAEIAWRAGRKVRYFHLSESLAAKRNFACHVARGSVICHFDDDDYSRPDRVSHQVELLCESGKAVVGYHTVTVEETRPIRVISETGKRPGGRWWLLHLPDQVAGGTSLCYRKEWALRHPFPLIPGEEDDRFFAEALAAGQALTVNGEHRIRVTNHAGCVSQRFIGGDCWEELLGNPYEAA